MANHNCNGDFFEVDGKLLYRCLWDSTIVRDPGKVCPNCQRNIEGDGIGPVETRTVIQAKVGSCWYELPSDSITGSADAGQS